MTKRKEKVSDTSNGKLQQKVLIYRNLPIITTPIDPWIMDRVATGGETSNVITRPTTKLVITDVARRSGRVLRTPCKHVSRTARDGTTPQDWNIAGPGNAPVMIGGTVSLTRTGIQFIFKPHGSTGYVEVRDTQIFNTSIDGNLPENGDSKPICSKVIRR